MLKIIFLLMFGSVCIIYSCNQKQPIANTSPQPVHYLTKAEAKDAVARYLHNQPDAALYLLDSAQAIDAGGRWQILIPRTDWADIMPNRAAFEVNKQTGEVSIRPVK